MSLALLVPMCVMCILLFLLFLSFSIQNEQEIRNITKALAETLQAGTRNKDSRKAIHGVLNLMGNLSDCISELENTNGYAQRMAQLENNIYVITELIQKYMNTYLYYEAGELAALRQNMGVWRNVSSIAAPALMLFLVLLSVRRVVRMSKSIIQPIDALYERVQEIGRGDLTVKTPVPAYDDKLQTLSDCASSQHGAVAAAGTDQPPFPL